MVTGPRTPDEAVETALEGIDVELRTSSEPGVPGMAGILGSTLKNGIGSIWSSFRSSASSIDEIVVVLG
jgi:hypothetical protein